MSESGGAAAVEKQSQSSGSVRRSGSADPTRIRLEHARRKVFLRRANGLHGNVPLVSNVGLSSRAL